MGSYRVLPIIVLTVLSASCGSFASNLAEVRSEREAEEAAQQTQQTPPPTLDDSEFSEALEDLEDIQASQDALVNLPLFGLDVGDCFTLEDQATGQDAGTVSCDEPHSGEVITTFSFAADDAFPEDQTLVERVSAECLPAFEEYTGTPYEDSPDLDIGYISPTATSWDSGDREVICYIVALDGSELQGSAAASG